MKVSVSFEDGVVVVDGVGRGGFTFSVDPNWRTLQWNGSTGWIEVHRGERIWLASIVPVQQFIDMHAAAAPPVPPPPTFEERRAMKIAALASKRWEAETGGTTFNGMPIATDAVSQTKYIGAVVGAQIDPTAIMRWKLANGSFVVLDAQAIVAVAMAVRAHVQSCFDREAELLTRINDVVTPADLDAINIYEGWPK